MLRGVCFNESMPRNTRCSRVLNYYEGTPDEQKPGVIEDGGNQHSATLQC